MRKTRHSDGFPPFGIQHRTGWRFTYPEDLLPLESKAWHSLEESTKRFCQLTAADQIVYANLLEEKCKAQLRAGRLQSEEFFQKNPLGACQYLAEHGDIFPFSPYAHPAPPLRLRVEPRECMITALDVAWASPEFGYVEGVVAELLVDPGGSPFGMPDPTPHAWNSHRRRSVDFHYPALQGQGHSSNLPTRMYLGIVADPRELERWLEVRRSSHVSFVEARLADLV